MPNILVVDDDPHIRRIVTMSLTDDSPYTVTDVSSGEAALLYISRNQVDLLFTDIRMPGMSGLELVQRVRDLELPLAVIVFTIGPEDLSPERAAELKIDCLLTKPVSPDKLRMAVDLLLDPQRLLPKKVTQAASKVGRPEANKPTIAVQLTPSNSTDNGRSFSAQQIGAMQNTLRDFSQEPNVYCALIADMSGILLTHWTRMRDLNVMNIAALAASNSIAMADLGRSLGKKEQSPRLVIHEGETQRILMTQIESLLLLIAVDNNASLGWARMALLRTCGELRSIIHNPRIRIAAIT